MNINAKVEITYVDTKDGNEIATRTISIPFVCTEEFFTDVNETLSTHDVVCKLVKE